MIRGIVEKSVVQVEVDVSAETSGIIKVEITVASGREVLVDCELPLTWRCASSSP
ncbi:MAG: hypothetical protein H0W20_05125 [Chthoniobacterales bacterium]|nr:hypothetical protein [Chthoniobacterales bacterium]